MADDYFSQFQSADNNDYFSQFKDDEIAPMAQPANKMGKFMSGVHGFNTGVEELTQGVMQPLFESGALGETMQNIFANAVKNREQNYEQASEANPFSAGIGKFLGGAAAAIPLAMAGGVGAAGIAPRASPYVQNVLSGIIGGGAIGGAQYTNPGESRLLNAILGSTLGGGISAAAPAVGRATGQSFNFLKGLLGSKGKVAKDMLEGLAANEAPVAQAKKSAAEALGLNLTPAEASGNPILAKAEGKLGTTIEGQKLLNAFKQGQKGKQKDVVGTFLGDIGPAGNAAQDVRQSAKNIISKQEKALQTKARPYYEMAEKESIKPNTFNSLMRDSNIEQAYTKVLNSKLYETELEGVSPTSVKFLDLVKRELDDQIEKSIRSGEKNSARILQNAKTKLVDTLDKSSPSYKLARSIYSQEAKPLESLRESNVGRIANMKDKDLKNVSKVIFDPSQTDLKVLAQTRDEFLKENPDAWKRIIRNEMERRLDSKTAGKTNNVGSNFYNSIVSTDRDYKQFDAALKGNPEAQKKLAQMRDVFKDLINSNTVKTAAGQSKSSLDVPRSTWQAIGGYIDELMGGKYDKAAIELITSGKWDKELGKVLKNKSKDKKAIDAVTLLKSISASQATKTSGKKE